MHNLICCWCNNNADGFESHVPLYFSGKRNRQLGFRSTIDALFFSGYELLSEDYKRCLEEVGYRVHDVSGIYRGLAESYSTLDQFGDYEKKCFLRWLVISSYFPKQQVIHYDGDVVFNEDPDVIARLLRGRTFVLQGCPALTSISDHHWFDHYREQLDRFTNDVRGYSELAWTEREGWETSEREKWAGQRFRRLISSDQDLLSHLIHTDRIVQHRPSAILNELQSYILFENPLYVHGYDNNLRHAKYERISGIDRIAGKRVLIWHMQSDFINYLSRFIFRKSYLRRRPKRLPINATKKDIELRLQEFLERFVHANPGSRINVYRYFFEKKDFSEIFSDRTWWQEGTFT